ncbi:protein-glutamate O-methyltransferase CheR [Phenylobacterium sp.]|uniref:CheR family methyltransferase n=1 Tax=Phenylobacterium sp. TaxID=1871053 RepID=UPI0035B193D3
MLAFATPPQTGALTPPFAEDPSASDLQDADAFARIAQFVEARAGIRTPPSRRIMLETNLRRRRITAGFKSLEDYLAFVLEGGGLATEAVELIDAATVNKTDFFREPRHFELMSQQMLPSLLEAGVRKIRAWSAACSTGPEPYSIAMMLQAAADRTPGLDYHVLGTDICSRVLAVAQQGIFEAPLTQTIPADIRRRYVRVSTDGRPLVRIAPELRAKMAFARLNLMDPVYPVGDPIHLIFCRNVLIYFDHAIQARVLRRLADRLAPGGYLVVGHSESMAGADLALERIDHTVFRKPE